VSHIRPPFSIEEGKRATVAGAGRREFLIGKGWIQAVVLVVLCGFFVLGLLAYIAIIDRRWARHAEVVASAG
jgi:hypothetical protein